MNTELLLQLINQSIASHNRFQKKWDAFDADDSLYIDESKALSVLAELETRLEENYPFFHPRYAGQMLKPPHEIAVAAYVMAMQVNPNNHALDGGPATAKMEMEVVQQIATMFGYKKHLGHLTSSGTIANLEALWIAKSIHPEKAIAYSSSAHYTHHRMCDVIGAKHVCLDNFNDIEQAITTHTIGTLVVTIGTTSLGQIEPLHEILPIAKKYGVRIHADCAYGGFFMLLAKDSKPSIDTRSFLLLNECDSIVIDPHKHGLQPYGCGCVLFKDPAVGTYYKHDSPYTYFTSKELHLGEISLECSRAGASAAALWATLQCFPLESEKGLGSVLKRTREAALQFSQQLTMSRLLCEYVPPELDIVTYFPRTKNFSASEVSSVVERTFTSLMKRQHDPLYLATVIVDSQTIKRRYPDFITDLPTAKIFRSVLMKPEHAGFVAKMLKEIEDDLSA
ncbi:MAG: aspartate aminotransferase family protein [Ignavibacteriales bacterium]|nr:aspartate aminotransferase family protein [Ignavibacteriales bacterium]